jgi:hypothetical protein
MDAIRFQGHAGHLVRQTNKVQFYRLEFKSIIEAIPFLIHLKPGNYSGWANGVHYGVTDGTMYYVANEKMWISEEELKKLSDFHTLHAYPLN